MPPLERWDKRVTSSIRQQEDSKWLEWSKLVLGDPAPLGQEAALHLARAHGKTACGRMLSTVFLQVHQDELLVPGLCR
eukprot:547710-Amphidinium_carterae.1